MRHRWLMAALCLGGLLMGTVYRPAAATVEPTVNFDCNFCNFPRAWTLSRGEGSRIICVADEQLDTRRVQRLAPAAGIECLSRSEWLAARPSGVKQAVLLLRCTVPNDDSDVVGAAVRRWVEQGVPVIVPVYLSWPETNDDRLRRRRAVTRLAAVGAILCGIHGREFQVGDLSLWQGVPVDVFALDPRINGDRAFGDDFRRMADMAGPAERVAAAVALLRCRYPQLTPARIRDRLHRFGRPTLWAEVDVQWQAGHHWRRVRPFPDAAGLERFLARIGPVRPGSISTTEGCAWMPPGCWDLPLLIRGNGPGRCCMFPSAIPRPPGVG